MDGFTADLLTKHDIGVESRSSPSHVVVYLKRSKHDPFGLGTSVHLGTTGQHLCPVAALLAYLAICPPVAGLLFLFHDGTTLSKPRLIVSLHRVLLEVGVDSSKYSGHSFHIGAAKTAAKLGVSDSLINILGQRRSLLFVGYIRTSWEQLLRVSSLLFGDGVVDTAEKNP